MDSILASLRPFAEVAQAVSALVSACTFLVGAGTLWKSIAEYRRGNSLKRFEKFQDMRKIFEEEGAIKRICTLLIDDDDELIDLDYRIKEDFLGFYEEIALMNQSQLLSDDITYYMFGYYALRAFQSGKFRSGLDLDSPYWALFCSLCRRLDTWEHEVLRGNIKASALSKRLRF